MSGSERVVIVVPGDDPVQIQGSPHLERLDSYGDVIIHKDRPGTAEEKIKRAKDAVCLLNTRGSASWPAEILRKLPNLKMATTCGIGTDAFDLDAARELGIVISNIPGRTAPVVAEHAFGLMMAAAKRAFFQTAELKAGRWTRMDNTYLFGKTLGLIGTGNIGSAMASLAKGIGMDLVAWTFHPTPERATALGVRFVEMDELLRISDVVTLHVQLTDQTKGMIGPREIDLMKRGAILVNTARGAIVDMPALVEALKSGHLDSAAIDVFAEEPLTGDHPLLSCEQVVLTPHNADQTPEGMDMLNAGVVDNVIAFLEGCPQNVVNP